MAEAKTKESWTGLVIWRIRCEWKREWRRSLLGMLWWFLEPLLYLLAFYVVFGLGFRSGGPEFVGFLLCGLVSWKWFSSSLLTSAGAISSQKGLISQVRCPKWIFPAVVVGSNFFKFLILLLIFLFFLPLLGTFPTMAWWHLPWVVMVQGMLVMGCSLLAAAITPFLPDIRIFLNHGLIVLMFSSGLTFDIRRLEPGVQAWMELNPVSVLFLSFRMLLLEGVAPDLWPLMGVFAIGLLSSWLGLVLLHRWDGVYAKLEML